jgi:hypothetical protein
LCNYVQKENEQLRVKAAARPPVDVCGLWRAKGIDGDAQEINESFVLRVSDDGRTIVGSHAPDAVRLVIDAQHHSSDTVNASATHA